MPTLHLISGLPCSGKTRYARELRDRSAAVLFCLDEWLITAFGKYAIDEVGRPEHLRRVLACRLLIWCSAAEHLRRATDVILDDGFFLRAHRTEHVELARALGGDSTIHHLDAPLDEVQKRLERRNAELPEFNFHIEPGLLERFAAVFETPAPTEGAELVVVRGE